MKKQALPESIAVSDAHDKTDTVLFRETLQSQIRELKRESKKVLKLEVEKARLQKDVEFFRATNIFRMIGASLLTIGSVLAPLMTTFWFGWYVYYVVVAASVTLIACGIAQTVRHTADD